MSFKLQLALFALAMGGLIYLASAQPVAPPACGDGDTQERVRALMFRGVEQAFSEQVASLYSVWVRGDETGQPRAKVGVDQAISVYVRARRAVEEWKLAPC